MKISELIRSNKELREMPFLTVYTVIRILSNMGILKNVETEKRKSN